jgi:hypothetical protein
LTLNVTGQLSALAHLRHISISNYNVMLIGQSQCGWLSLFLIKLHLFLIGHDGNNWLAFSLESIQTASRSAGSLSIHSVSHYPTLTISGTFRHRRRLTVFIPGGWNCYRGNSAHVSCELRYPQGLESASSDLTAAG